MEVVFLGTAAATAVPLPFCGCDLCKSARVNKGHDIRRRSSVIIDGKILIDMGSDSVISSLELGVDISRAECLLQTHSHSDHFDAGHMITRISDYASENVMPMTVFASQKCAEHMSEKLSREEEGATLMTDEWRSRLNVKLNTVKHGDRVMFEDYEIIAIESSHDTYDESLMYIVRKGNSAFFYACDTLELTDSAWALIESLDFEITCSAVDQCYGPYAKGGGHMCAAEVAKFVERLKCERVYATHISHEGTPCHAELEKWTSERGYHVAYDGLRLLL